jgi:hypothetical protein
MITTMTMRVSKTTIRRIEETGYAICFPADEPHGIDESWYPCDHEGRFVGRGHMTTISHRECAALVQDGVLVKHATVYDDVKVYRLVMPAILEGTA